MSTLRRIKIHNIEDDEGHSTWVKYSFYLGEFALDKKDKDNFIDDNFEFKRFKVVGKAIQYYKDTKDYPDIIIIDIDFSGLSNNSEINHELEATRDRGLDMIRFALQYFPDKIIIPFTGQYSLIYREFKEFEHLLSHIPKMDKGQPDNLEYENTDRLRKVAKKYFAFLTLSQRKHIKSLLNEEDENKILKYPLMFGKHRFQLRHLLLGWWEQGEENIKNVRGAIESLLKSTEREYDFQGFWEKGKAYEPIWRSYLEEDNQSKYDEVNYAAFNFLLECVFWHKAGNDEFIDGDSGNLKIDSTFYNVNARVTSKLNNEYETDRKWEIFKAKLIGRRVLMGWGKFYNGQKSLIEIVDFLVNGRNKPYGSRMTDVISTNLGLKKIPREGKFDVENRLLPDEEVWLNKFVPLISDAHEFLIYLNSKVKGDFEKELYFLSELRNLDMVLKLFSHNTAGLSPKDLIRYNLLIKEIFNEIIPYDEDTRIISFADNSCFA